MKRTMWFSMGLWVCAAVAIASDPPKSEGTSKDPKEILIKADAATKKVQAVKYQASAKGTGANAARAPEVKGSAILAGSKSDQGLGKYRIDIKLPVSKESTEMKEVTVGSDGETYFLIDSQTQTVYEDMDRSVVGNTGRPAMSLAMREFCHPEPFGDEIKAEKQELKEDKKVGSEDCYQILVVYAGGQQQALWCFSKKDFLPRSVERSFKGPTGESGGSMLEVTDLAVDPKLSEDTFKATVPEGFKKTDDFAP